MTCMRDLGFCRCIWLLFAVLLPISFCLSLPIFVGSELHFHTKSVMDQLYHYQVFNCGNCVFHSRLFPRLLSHYRDEHEFQRDFSVTCGIDMCQKSYSNVSSFQKHILKKHKDFHRQYILHQNEQRDEGQNRPIADAAHEVLDIGQPHLDDALHDMHEGALHEDAGNEIDGDDPMDMNQEDMNIGSDVNQRDFNYVRHLGRFLLMLRETKKIPMNVCAEIVSEIHCILTECQDGTRAKLEAVLLSNGIAFDELDRKEEIFQCLEKALFACNDLSSESKQNRFFSTEFKFIEPVEIVLGTNENGHEDTAIYVPIKESLLALLSHDDVLACVLNDHTPNDGKLRDYCDGTAYATNHLFAGDRPALQLKMYLDDFQVTNPLGNKTKNFKILGIYFVLGNLPPQHRSKLYVIQLAVLVRSSHVRKYGMKAVLRLLLADLKSLESDGLILQLSGGGEIHFCGTVSMVLADNLAAHEISGMLESFSGHRVCRFCTADRQTDMQEKFNEKDFTLRTTESYNAAVASVEIDQSLATVYGIKSRSVLNDLSHYHVTWGVPSDIAHDIFEGIGCDVIEFCVRHFIQMNCFTLSELNNIIATFAYAVDDKVNKPTPMSNDLATFRIKQTAAQTWCLMRLLPLMIGSLVPRHDNVWEMYLDFLDIVDILCSPTLDNGSVEYLRMAITRFCEEFFSLNQGARVKPKAHFMIHYASQIKRFGPLSHCNTLRFESKHGYFKEIANRTKNRRNICKTMATRHQYLQAFYMSSPSFLELDELESTKGSVIPIRLLNVAVQQLLLPFSGPDESVYQSNSVKGRGAQFEAGSGVVLDFENDEYQFGKVESIFIISGNVFLLVRKLETEEFAVHYHAYIVSDDQEDNRYTLVQPDKLMSFHQLGIYKVGDELMIVKKFYIEHD